MFSRLFGARRTENEKIVGQLYDGLVAAARQPRFYADWSVPDTPLGRYEMMAVHMFLVLRRMRGAQDGLAGLAQDLTDEFFKDVDHSLRELGIGDTGVPKRMKKLARMFYGRAESYGAALDAGDREALIAALARNVAPGDPQGPWAAHLADYVIASAEKLARQDDEALLAGQITFLPAESIAPTTDE